MEVVDSRFKGIAISWDSEDNEQANSFVKFVNETLDRLFNLPLGKDLLAEFTNPDGLLSRHEKGHTLIIRPPMLVKFNKSVKIDVAETKSFDPNKEKAGKLAQIIETWWPGSEKSSLKAGIKIPPSKWKNEFGQKRVVLSGSVPMKHIKFPKVEGDGDEFALPPEKFYYAGQIHTFQIALIHEMIHAWHGICGTSLVSPGSKDATSEEKQVVGLPPYHEKKYTENKFRFLLDMPLRENYVSLNITLSGQERIQFTDFYNSWCMNAAQ